MLIWVSDRSGRWQGHRISNNCHKSTAPHSWSIRVSLNSPQHGLPLAPLTFRGRSLNSGVTLRKSWMIFLKRKICPIWKFAINQRLLTAGLFGYPMQELSSSACRSLAVSRIEQYFSSHITVASQIATATEPQLSPVATCSILLELRSRTGWSTCPGQHSRVHFGHASSVLWWPCD